jgi:hypothetical protein
VAYEYEDEKGEYFVQPPEIGFLRRALQYKIPLEKAIIKDSVKFLRIRILSKYADEICLMLRKIRLYEGEKIFFYTPDKKYISQSYTAYNINDSGILSSPILKTDEIILEYNSTNFNEIGHIEIASVSHFFPKEESSSSKLIQRSSNCLWDVNCSQYNEYCNQIRSTVWIMKGKGGICSGALINNPKNDGTHYILTAQHCIDYFEPIGNFNILYVFPVVGAVLDFFFDVQVEVPIPIDRDRDPDFDIQELRIVYNYQNPICKNDDLNNYGIDKMVSTGVDWVKFSGYFDGFSNLSNDIAIIKMNRKPELQWNVYYAGWTTETNRDNFGSDEVKSISHPGSRDKKFAIGNLIPTAVPPMWTVVWNKGIPLGGSSGSPLFNVDKKIIGPYSGGLVRCGGFSSDFILPPIRPFINYVNNTSFYGKLGMWKDFNNIVGNNEFDCDGFDPILACQPHLDLNDEFWAPASWRADKPSIKIQAANTINVSTDKDVLFRENAEYQIVAGDEINISDETGTSPEKNRFIINNTELEFYTSDCEWTEDKCGFNYFKMASAGKNSNLVEFENESTEIKIHPNPTTQNSTLTLIGYQDKKVAVLVLDQSGKSIFYKTISKVESKQQILEIESRDWSNGIYIVRVMSNQDTKSLKLVKE